MLRHIKTEIFTEVNIKMHRMRLSFVFVAVVVAVTSTTQALHAGQVYLSLGDSVGYGLGSTVQLQPTFGDQGYASLYADYLATQLGGVRPDVINLAIPGETSTSFSTGAGRVGPSSGVTDAQLASINLNYDIPSSHVGLTQEALLGLTLAGIHSAGDTVNSITISLGSNDLFALVLSKAFNTPGADQGALLMQANGQFAQKEAALVASLQQAAPGANIFLLGTYNPFPAAPQSPYNLFAIPAITGLNGAIHQVADLLHVRYVDIYTPFVGHEPEYTRINDPSSGDSNVHPTLLGYSVIAAQIEGVPEPSTVVAAAIGVFGFALSSRRFRKRTIG